jgi:hypothetical protein
MPNNLVEEIRSIVGDAMLDTWLYTNPKVFYKNGKPYGLIGMVNNYVASTTISPELPFTKSMIKYILDLDKEKDIILITDDHRYIDKIKSLLEKRGCVFEIKDGLLFTRRSK